jgi:hypothetical protein
MKYLIALLTVFVMGLFPINRALAVEPTLANIGAVLIAGSFVPVVAQITGNADRLCTAVGGRYTPENNMKNLDVCPGGSITSLFARPK